MKIECRNCKYPIFKGAKCCIKCGTKTPIVQAGDKNALPVVMEASASKPGGSSTGKAPDVTTPSNAKAHGFRRLGDALGDDQMRILCEQGVRDVPEGHPVERLAECVADLADFTKTPGGKTLFGAIKKGIAGFFSE